MIIFQRVFKLKKGWWGGAMVLGKLPVPGRPTIWIIVWQGPTALAVGAGGGCLDILTVIYPFFPLSPSLWETARYRLKYCLKGLLNPKPTNQPNQFKEQTRICIKKHHRGDNSKSIKVRALLFCTRQSVIPCSSLL